MRILRYEVPAASKAVIEIDGDPLAVGCRDAHFVEFWAMSGDGPLVRRTFLIVGTGHPFDEGLRYWGTAVAPGGQLVWHLLEDPR